MALLNHHLPHYRIAVVGSGAVGCYYGGRLAQHGRDVHFLMRSDYEHVRRHGLMILSKQGDAHLQGVKVHRTPEDMGPCDLVIIALKSTANAALETIIPPLLHENTMLLTLQNGLGNEEFLAERYGAERVLGGLCHVCINRTAPGVIEHLAQGLIAMGEFSGWPQPRTHEIASEFKRCGIVCSVEESLSIARWKKLVWNIPFNGLSIVGGNGSGGLDTAQILSDDSLTCLVRGLMHEVISAARKLGCEIPTSLADDMIKATKAMGGYRTSSLIDFEGGREVEVDAIWGEPLRRAANAGAEVGRMEMLYHLLKRKVADREVGDSVKR
jgi:2-dehydropantoate 2-reductase